MADPLRTIRTWPRQARPWLRRTADRLPAPIQAASRRAVWLAQGVWQRWRYPLVSVIVPYYNVEAYFAECLDSVLAQSYRHLEIILVDDGSTDGCYEIARSFARRDRRIRIVRQANAGLGAARNTGVRHASGAYLRFVDSDDVLPVNSIAVMIRSILATRSDFVVGSLTRMSFSAKSVPGWARETHRIDRLGIRLTDMPDILKDVFAHNKLFDAEFFRTAVREFPEGIRYEDQEPTARAYVNGTFDVLEAVVYHWRIREDGTSITQQKTNPEDLRDRLEVKSRVATIIAQGSTPGVVQHWLAKAAGFDLRPYYEQVPRTDEDFWKRLREGVLRITSQLDLEVWQLIPMVDRLLTLAVVQDRRSALNTLLVRRDEYGFALPGIIEDGAVRLDPAYLADIGLDMDQSMRRFSDAEIRIRARAVQAEWTGDQLVLHGSAHLTQVDLARTTAGLSIDLISERTGTGVAVDVETSRDAWIDVDSGDSYNSYAESAFRAVVDLAAGSDALGPGQVGDVWHFRLRIRADGIERVAPILDLDGRGPLGHLPVGRLGDEGRWVLTTDPSSGLGLRYQPTAEVTLTDLQIDGSTLTVVAGGRTPEAIELRSYELGRTVRASPTTAVPGEATFVLRLPDPPEDRPGVEWRVRAVVDRAPQRLFWPGTTLQLYDRFPAHLPVRAICSREGTIRLEQHHWGASITELSLRTAPGTPPVEQVVVQGLLIPLDGATYGVRLVRDELERTAVGAVTLGPDGRFEGAVDLRSQAGAVLTEGSWLVEMVLLSGAHPTSRLIPIDERKLSSYPLRQQTNRSAIRVTRTRDGGARVYLGRPYPMADRGRLAQRDIHSLFQPATPPELRDAVVLECFAGKSVGDSVLAIFHELRRRHPEWSYYWSVAEATTPVPDGCEPLLRHSRRWTETVRTARWLINNANFPAYFRKQPGQTYVQTWHGTPLKKIGNDVPATSLSLSYRDLMTREVTYWDYLLAQNPFAAEALPRAFGYHGPVIDEGYPRNDALRVGPEQRAEARARLGLPPDRRVVLYAPTWRDNVRNERRQYALVSYFDFDEAAARLPEATFLLRGHANTVSTGSTNPAVIDVSGLPDINELLIAADALVTDYSSVMFDFCVTGRPILLLVPDLETYRDSTRGFYLDLAEVAPGPVCMSSTELVEELVQLESFDRRFHERYAGFAARFARLDDGSAARRVVDRLLGAE